MKVYKTKVWFSESDPVNFVDRVDDILEVIKLLDVGERCFIQVVEMSEDEFNKLEG